jgi:hypothetical protein
MNNNLGNPPEFDGLDLINQPFQKWFAKLNRWFIVNNVAMARWRPIMENVLNSPARETYQTDVAAGGILHANLVAPDNAAAIEANWEAIEDWFNVTYNGPEHQRALRAALPKLSQTLDETPRKFYLRIGVALREAGYQQAVIGDLSETMWMNGIHPDVLQHIQGLAHLSIENLIKAADGFWISTIQRLPIRQNRNAAYPVPRELKPKPTQFNYRPRYEQESEEEEIEEYEPPKQILKRPKARKAQQQPQEDPAMAKLTKMMEKLQVHVANLERKSNRPGPQVE